MGRLLGERKPLFRLGGPDGFFAVGSRKEGRSARSGEEVSCPGWKGTTGPREEGQGQVGAGPGRVVLGFSEQRSGPTGSSEGSPRS